MTICLEGYLDVSELPSVVETQDARRNRLSYDWTERGERIHTKGFPNHTKECMRVLADYIGQRSVLELGAGTGFLARHLHDRGVNIRAIDSQKGCCTQPVWWEENKLYFPVEAIDALSFNAYAEDIVLLAWPCYESSFAAEVVERLRVGQFLIYLGESQGGCTADDEFFKLIEADNMELQLISHELRACYVPDASIHDNWTVLKKIN